jgi:hypothetical protein
METLELPVLEEVPETQWSAGPPPKLEEQPMDIAAFQLLRDAGRLDSGGDE